MWKWLKKFALEIAPPVTATVLGAFVVHQLWPSGGSTPQPAATPPAAQAPAESAKPASVVNRQATRLTPVCSHCRSDDIISHAIVQWSWNFGDPTASGNSAACGGTPNSNTASTPQVCHQFLTPGTYNVTLSVLDDTGQRNVTTKSVTVTP